MKISASGIPSSYSSLYWRCWKLDDSKIWNTAGTPAFEAFDNANYADYAVTATRIGSTEYIEGDVPATLPSGTVVRFELCSYSGSPAQGDQVIYSDTFVWDGTNRLWVHSPITEAMTESYAADGAEATVPQLLYMLWSKLQEFSISGTTVTSKKLDGSTTAMTHTLNDASNPTSLTRAS